MWSAYWAEIYLIINGYKPVETRKGMSMSAIQGSKIIGRGRGFILPKAICTTSNLHRSKSTGDIQWLWKADKTIEDYHFADLQGTRRGATNLTLNSAKPLHPDQVHQALVHLQKKAPVLQTCILHRGDSTWFCKPPNLQIDFKAHNAVHCSDIVEEALDERFQTPEYGQWLMRFITEPLDAKSIVPNLENFPHKYNMIFTCHHGLTDGTDTIFLIKSFQNLLNDVIAGKPISDEVYNFFDYNEEKAAIMSNLKERLKTDKEFYEEVKNSIQPPDEIPLLLQAYPRPKNVPASTQNIASIIDNDIITKFQSKAKEAGVTFNSSFVSVMATAIMELVKEKGIIQDSYDIAVHIYAEHRRYWKPSKKHIFGLNTSPMSYTSTVDKHVREGFWDYSKKTHKELQKMLVRGTPLEQKAFRELTEEGQLPYDYLNRIRPASHDFTVTNVGDFSTTFTGVGDHVQITNLVAKCNIHNSFNSSLNELFTFRGKCYHSLDYTTDYFEDETVRKFVNKVLELLKFFSH